MGISNAVPRTIWLIRSASLSKPCSVVKIEVRIAGVLRSWSRREVSEDFTRKGASENQVSVFKFHSLRKIKW